MHLSRSELAAFLPSVKHVHFIGITAPFHSFCASVLINQGKTITASEQNQESEAAEQWIARGVLIRGPHKKENITATIELVIFPNGIIPGNPEAEETIKMQLPYTTLQELLGAISTAFKTIAIAGTHGKTTTTAIIIWLLHKTIGTPSFIIGDTKTRIEGLESNWQLNPDSPYLVIEACEYKKQFLERAPRPYISVITHIDLDHTDFYHSQEEYNQAFIEFISPTTSAVIIDDSQVNEQQVLEKYPKNSAKILSVTHIKEIFGRIETSLFGKHNQENLVRAAGVGLLLGIKEQTIRDVLQAFSGVSSRFEYKGTTQKGMKIYEDYAHNPAKVRACLEGAREAFPDKQLIVLYQPHNIERTFSFQNEFVSALGNCDILIFPNIYSLREQIQEKTLISPREFYQKIKAAYPTKRIIFTDDVPPYEKTIKVCGDIDN